jgi:drug/metabolite transporter (DMT)-like permease
VLGATVLALTSAALHASWNLLVKTAPARDLMAWGQFVLGGLLVVPVLVVLGWPEPATWPYLAASAVVHVGYVTGLVQAYTHGDFSLAYPLARGAGALLAAVGGALLLGDGLSAAAWAAVVVVGGGLASLGGRRASSEAIGWALFTAACIATYTLIDARGARTADSGVVYGLATMPCIAVSLTIAGVARGRGQAFVGALRTDWRTWALAGLGLCAAYTLVLVAIRQAPVGYVAVLRESSVVFGALLGWLLLHEALGGRRLVSSVVILVGLVGLVAASW